MAVNNKKECKVIKICLAWHIISLSTEMMSTFKDVVTQGKRKRTEGSQPAPISSRNTNLLSVD